MPPAAGHLLCRAAPAETPVGLSIAPQDTFVVKGHTFQMRVYINTDFTDFMGYDITIHFDNTRLQVVSVDEGTFPTGSGYPTFFRWLNEGAVDDEIQVNGAILGHGIQGHGILFTMTFQATQLNIADVGFSSIELRNGMNQTLPWISTDAIVRIITSIDSEALSWGEIKSRYR